MKRIVRLAVSVLALAMVGLVVVACTSDESKNSAGNKIAEDRSVYAPVNDVEGANYNARQKIADNPATLIWCTAFPTSPNAKAFTVPIVGKLTSGNKRPYPTEQAYAGNVDPKKFNPEVAGPDGMFGTSGEYRYGFDPNGQYHDFYGIETYCTTVPNVVQREQTTIIAKAGADVVQLDAKVEAALKACRDKDPDPSKPCPAAAALLGG